MKRALGILALAAIGLALVTARVLWSSRTEWRDAEAKLAAGDGTGAVDGFGRAARLYAPASPWVRRSLDRLQEIGERAEAAGQPQPALAAWNELRASVLATRSLYTPNRDRLARADEHIAALMARVESPAVDPGADEAARRRWHAARLAETSEPSVGWSLLALAGLFAWIAAAAAFLLRAVDENDRLRRGAALACALALVAGFAAFLLGLARA